MTALLAHGLGAVRDLPVPLWLFYYGAGAVLIVSFVALGALWRKPVLEARKDGRELPPRVQRTVLGPELRALLGLVGVFLFGLVFATALLGEPSAATNFAPTFVYVVFWLGLVPLVVLLGNVWRALNPWRAVADAVAWVGERLGGGYRAPLAYPERLGRWPAAVLLFLWAVLELAYPNSASPRALAVAIAVYSWVTWVGMAAYGRDAWTQNGEAFTVYFGLLARLAPFGVEEREPGRRRVVVRPPATALAGRARVPGTVAFVAVMLGSVAFDSFSRTTWWQDRVFEVETAVVTDSVTAIDLLITVVNLVALLALVAIVAAVFLLAVGFARRISRRREELSYDFVLSLVPIALAYVVAHYFSLLVFQGQVVWALISDPFGWGWNLFGTADFEADLTVISPNTVWYVQVAALVAGHVLGLVLAHDRAVTVFRSAAAALRTQYAMLVLMVAYTVGGLWLLANG